MKKSNDIPLSLQCPKVAERKGHDKIHKTKFVYFNDTQLVTYSKSLVKPISKLL